MIPKSPIILSILSAQMAEFAERLDIARKTTKAVHLDVIDNDFCEGRTLPIDEWPKLNIDYSEAHLMVKNPLALLEQLAKQKVIRVIVHIESNFDAAELSRRAKELDLLLGFAVNPDTDLDRLRSFYE